MSAVRILIVEDEAPIREMIAFHLARAGFESLEAADCKEARRLLADERPQLVLVDWMLPDMSGLELVRMIRRERNNDDLAIIMLTAKSQEADKISGLDSGADDYITKPFSSRELIARINAALRRIRSEADDVLQAGDLRLEVGGHRVLAGGTEIALGPTEYRLLKHFMENPGRVFSRAQLLDRVWGSNVYVEERTVDVHVTRLRKALTEHGLRDYVQTVRGAGYRFSASTKGE